jgi:hypothetical protein
MATTINEALANRQADSVGSDLNSGFIDIYDGTQPADPDDGPDGTLLISFPLASDAYADAVGGVAAKNGTISASAVATGDATYAQQRNAANTRWMYGSVTETGGGGQVTMTDTSIVSGQPYTITSSTITQPNGT